MNTGKIGDITRSRLAQFVDDYGSTIRWFLALVAVFTIFVLNSTYLRKTDASELFARKDSIQSVRVEIRDHESLPAHGRVEDRLTNSESALRVHEAKIMTFVPRAELKLELEKISLLVEQRAKEIRDIKDSQLRMETKLDRFMERSVKN